VRDTKVSIVDKLCGELPSITQ